VVHDEARQPGTHGRPDAVAAAVGTLRGGGSLSETQARDAFAAVMTGLVPEPAIAELLTLLAARVPTVDEIAGAAAVMRANVDRVETGVAPELLLDTAGTGGTAKLFNVSTAAAIVAAAAGARVAKHGNRSRTGRGSAEVMAQLGVDVGAGRDAQRRCMDEAGICFCFTPNHHPAARHAAGVRKALGFPTMFNLVGPLTNPGGARRQIMGVWKPEFVHPVAQALARLGAVHAIVLHGTDGLDELSITAPTMVAEVRDGRVTERTVTPEDLGIARAPHQALVARDLEHAAELVRSLLDGREQGAPQAMLAANAGAALVAAGRAPDLLAGVAMARQAIASGAAMRTLERLRTASRA
jgi:anthranilate phosphoribosyltransferase